MYPTTLTVADVLRVPVVQAAEPVLLTPAHSADRSVRWVHTSEIYDIGPLLRGDELLLTTGLGLVGQSPPRLAAYIDSLADRGVAGLCFELGRTFDTVPAPLLDRAVERGLAVVALGAIVPFVEVTEAVHELLLSAELQAHRAVDALSDELLEAIAEGAAEADLVGIVSRAVGGPVHFDSSTGALTLLAGSGGWPSSAPLAAHDIHAADAAVPALVSRASALLDLHTRRERVVPSGRAGVRRAFFRALVDPAGHGERLDADALRLGVAPARDRRLVAVGIDVVHADLERLVPRVERVLGEELGPAVAVVDGCRIDVVVSVRHPLAGEHVPQPQLPHQPYLPPSLPQLLAEAAARALVPSATIRWVLVSVPDPDLAGLGEGLRQVRAGAAVVPVLARGPQSGEGPRVLTTRDVALATLLVSGGVQPEVRRLVDIQIGAVLDHDARHRGLLMPTLETFLHAGGNKAATASALGIQRQTLYDRLARLAVLTGVDLGDPAGRLGVSVAVLAWRLRTGATGWADRDAAAATS